MTNVVSHTLMRSFQSLTLLMLTLHALPFSKPALSMTVCLLFPLTELTENTKRAMCAVASTQSIQVRPAQLVAHRQTQVYITCREFEIKARHVAISMEKPKYKAEEILKTCSCFILETHNTLLLNFVKMCYKECQPNLGCELIFFVKFPCCQCTFIAHNVQKNTHLKLYI